MEQDIERSKRMSSKENSLCFSGHRSEKLPQDREQLKKLKIVLWEEIDKAIQDGITTFYYGGCYGFDLIAASIVEQRKRVIKLADPKLIRLIAVLPYEGQSNYWNEDDRNLYFDLLSKSDDVITLNTRFKIGCYYDRNRYMVDRSSRLICYCANKRGGTKYTKDYAEKNSLQITNLYKKMDR